jgi:hypothetical protein
VNYFIGASILNLRGFYGKLVSGLAVPFAALKLPLAAI